MHEPQRNTEEVMPPCPNPIPDPNPNPIPDPNLNCSPDPNPNWEDLLAREVEAAGLLLDSLLVDPNSPSLLAPTTPSTDKLKAEAEVEAGAGAEEAPSPRRVVPSPTPPPEEVL